MNVTPTDIRVHTLNTFDNPLALAATDRSISSIIDKYKGSCEDAPELISVVSTVMNMPS